MAIVRRASFGGQRKTNVLSGRVRLEEGNKRIIVTDETGIVRIIIGFDEGGF